MIKSRKQMYLVIGAFALVLMLGTVTYAFFNYTRTGSANTIRTGRIAFNSQQGNSINLTNVFPVDVSNGIPNNNPNVGSVTINVTGDTTYGEGVEYLVSAVNVQNTIGSGANAKSLPISIDVSVASNTNNDPATTLGNADESYFTNRGASVQSSIYKVLASDVIENNDQLVVGYIKSGATGVDGNIVIRAYLDESKIAISDTYPEGTVHTVKTTGYSSSACETVLTGVANASTYCASASSLQDAIDNEDLTSTQITLLVNAGIVEEYTDGTSSSWVGNRTVFTTTEWNSLQTNGVSFQVKVESNEGTWVTAPIVAPTIDSCPGCKFVYTTNWYNYGGTNNINATEVDDITETVTNDYTTLNENYFLGFTETQDGKIDRAFACGIKGENPNQGVAFCIEGSTNGSTLTANNALVSALYGTYDGETGLGCTDNNGDLYCYGSVTTYAYISGNAFVGLDGDAGGCSANDVGNIYCY